MKFPKLRRPKLPRWNGRLISIWVITVCAVLLVFMGFNTLARLNQQTEQVKQLQEQNKELSRQNKLLQEDGIFLADRNIFYTKCIARLFTEYTQTRRPITLDNLLKCDFTIQDDGSFQQMFVPTHNDSRSTTPSVRAPLPPSQRAKPETPPPPPPEEPPGLVDQLLDFLGAVL